MSYKTIILNLFNFFKYLSYIYEKRKKKSRTEQKLPSCPIERNILT